MTAAPTASPTAALRDRLRRIRALRGSRPPDLREHLADLVLLGSSSRSGSSVLAEILRRSGEGLHLRGESNPSFVLAGLGWPESGEDSDALAAGAASGPKADSLVEELAWECGSPADRLEGDADAWAFAVDLAARLSVQWTELDFQAESVHSWMQDTLAELRHEPEWAGGRFPDAARFHASFLRRVTGRHPEVDPRLYDLPASWVSKLPGAVRIVRPPAPPSDPLVEEPPFICIGPWRPATAQDLGRVPLVVKSPSLAYRLDFVVALFPRTRVRVVHLVRNAAASVNGLIDGWLHPGFWSRRSDLALRIAGYSDVERVWGARWWKYDLPPGWQAHVESPLDEVCAFQWTSATRAVADFLDGARSLPRHRVRFEDLSGSPAVRAPAWDALAGFLGFRGAALHGPWRDGIPPVMATRPPAPGRWRARAPVIEPMARRPEVRALMERIGYGDDPRSWH